MRTVDSKDFGFGLEAEFLLTQLGSGKPLWHEDLSFDRLNTLLESIPLTGFSGLADLELEPPHRKCMPYVVEGYHVPDAEFRMVDLRPKGLEIRTPVSKQLEGCITDFAELYRRMQFALEGVGLRAATLSHHPVGTRFVGPQNKRRHDFWRWAMEAMTTYGPDVNVSLPSDLSAKIDLEDLDAKINAYAPAMAALSVASPFLGGDLWKIRGAPGQSVRSYRRSVVAPAVEIHPEEDGRLEFKVFEMSPRLDDYRAFFLLFLELLLDEGLADRSSAASRIFDMGPVARFGIGAEEVRARAAALLERAPVTLRRWGFDPAPLSEFERRWDLRRAPAVGLIERFESGEGLESILRSLSHIEGT
jgi:carboxylate-amine ligase